MQYFHPDNMSSAEKMKIELAKVRDEFKMSDSDCGSARVQGKGGLHFSLITLFHLERMHVSDFCFLVHEYNLFLWMHVLFISQNCMLKYTAFI